MKFIKISSIMLLALLLMCAFIPQASAKHHHRYKSRSSFGMGFNVAQTARYRVAPAPVAVYRPVVAPAPVYYSPYYSSYYYPEYYAPAPVIIERPVPSVYVQPGFSFSFWN